MAIYIKFGQANSTEAQGEVTIHYCTLKDDQKPHVYREHQLKDVFIAETS